MAFDLAVWRAETRHIMSDFAHDPRATLARAGTNTIYAMLLGSTVLPLIAAYAHDTKAAIAVFISITSELGGNIIANLAQQKYDNGNALAIATQEAQSRELAPIYKKLAEELQVIDLAEQALVAAGQTTILERLRAELRETHVSSRTHNQHVSGNARVGVAVAGDVYGNITYNNSSNMADKVISDQVRSDKIPNGGAPKPADTNSAHIQRLIDLHTRRLRILEEQAARSGYTVRPEIQTEIEDIRLEIARLQAWLNP